MPDNSKTLQPNTSAPNTPAANKRNAQNDVITIDLVQLFYELRRHIALLILTTVIGGGLGFAISRFVLTPTYTSTSMIYVMSKETTLTSLADLQIGSQLTQDYKVLVTSRTVMEDVIQKLGLKYDYATLRKKVTLDNPSNTRILNISVLDTDPKMAKQLTDAVADSASSYIADIMEQDPPKIIEYGEIPLHKTGPKTGRNTAIAALLFLMAAVAFVTIDMLTNDTIKTEDDIENYFGLPVLAAIPEKDAAAAKKSEQYNYAANPKSRNKNVKKGAKR